MAQLSANPAAALSAPGGGGRSSVTGGGTGAQTVRHEEHTWLVALAEVDGNKRRHTLLNPLHAPPDSPLRELADVFIRLEYLSHVLVWSETPLASPEDICSIDLVELPRLKLSFRVEAHPFKLCCVEHAGQTVAPPPDDPRTKSLLACMPSSLLLENAQGEHCVLVSATTLPYRPALKAASVIRWSSLLCGSTLSVLRVASVVGWDAHVCQVPTNILPRLLRSDALSLHKTGCHQSPQLVSLQHTIW